MDLHSRHTDKGCLRHTLSPRGASVPADPDRRQSRAVRAWNEQGKSVLLQKEIPAQMRFGEIVRFTRGGDEK